MRISVSDAKARLTDLVRRAESGEEVILTRHGHAAARLTPIRAEPDRRARRAIIESVRANAGKATSGPSAERSQDFLYDEDGLPG
ncbi:type II toxin-antitoxin system prevent-host-death family antitoxin [soil metagenome]